MNLFVNNAYFFNNLFLISRSLYAILFYMHGSTYSIFMIL